MEYSVATCNERFHDEWELAAPEWPAIRQEILEAETFDNILRIYHADGVQPHESLLMIHRAPREEDDERLLPDDDSIGDLDFPCCTCGSRVQQIDIPAAVHAAWKNKDADPFGAMIKSASARSNFPMVLAASLSAYAPQMAYDQMCKKLDDINTELAKLHAIMLQRENHKDVDLDAYQEAAVLSMLEENYSYTYHGSSIGCCNLSEYFRKQQPPRFVIKK